MVSGARPGRGIVSGMATAALALHAPRAHAESPRLLRLDWQTPAECPAGSALEQRVEQLVAGHDTLRLEPLDARGRVTRTDDGTYRGELTLRDGDTERTRIVDARTCIDLAEASAVVLALAIAPGADGDEAPSIAMPALGAPEPAPAPAGPPDVPRDAPSLPPHAPPSRSRETPVRVNAGVVLDTGTLGSAALGFALTGAVELAPAFELGARASWLPARESLVPGYETVGVRLSLAAVAPAACFVPVLGGFALSACGEFELGALFASGFGTPIHLDRASAWLAPGLGVAAAYPAGGRVRARLSGDALFPLGRTEFVVTGIGVAHRLPAASARFGAAVELVWR